MEIVLVTELFVGMEDELEQKLGAKTTAVYDLVKGWCTEHHITCIREIRMSWKQWGLDKIKSVVGCRSVYDEIPQTYNVSGITVYNIKYLAYPQNKLCGPLFYKWFAKKINKFLLESQIQPDVIVSHMPTFNSMYYIDRLLAKVPKVAVLHRSDIDKLYQGQQIIKYRKDILENSFDKIFSRSNFICQKAKEAELSKVTNDIVSSAVPMNYNDSRRWRKLGNNEITIMYAGSLIEQKGVQQIIKSVSNLVTRYNIKFLIIGSGKYESKLRELTKSLEVEEYVEFLGRKSREEVYSYMREADLFVMPSYHETLGLVYLEAMSSGCITIGSKKEGIDGIIVDGENGYLVEPKDSDELTRCLKKIFESEVFELENISRNAIKTAEKYSEESVTQKYLGLLLELVDGHNR